MYNQYMSRDEVLHTNKKYSITANIIQLDLQY